MKTEFSCGECWHVQKILNIMSRGRAGCISDYYMIIINFMSTQNFYSRYHQKNWLKYTASLLVLFQIIPRDSLPRILQKHWTTINYQQTRAFFSCKVFCKWIKFWTPIWLIHKMVIKLHTHMLHPAVWGQVHRKIPIIGSGKFWALPHQR